MLPHRFPTLSDAPSYHIQIWKWKNLSHTSERVFIVGHVIMANQHQFWRVLILQILPFSNSVGQRSVRLSTENKCRHNLLLHQWDIGQSGQHWLFQAWVASRYRLKIWGSLKKNTCHCQGHFRHQFQLQGRADPICPLTLLLHHPGIICKHV